MAIFTHSPYKIHFRHTIPRCSSDAKFESSAEQRWCSWHIQGDLIQLLIEFDIRIHFKEHRDFCIFRDLFQKICNNLDEFSFRTPDGEEAMSIIAENNEFFQSAKSHQNGYENGQQNQHQNGHRSNDMDHENQQETVGRPLNIGIGLSNEVALIQVDENAEEHNQIHEDQRRALPNGIVDDHDYNHIPNEGSHRMDGMNGNDEMNHIQPSAIDIDGMKAMNQQNGHPVDHHYDLHEQRIQSQKEYLSLQHEYQSVLFERDNLKSDLERKTQEMEEQQHRFEMDHSRILSERDELQRELKERETAHQMERKEMKEVLDSMMKEKEQLKREKEQLKRNYKTACNDCVKITNDLNALKEKSKNDNAAGNGMEEMKMEMEQLKLAMVSKDEALNVQRQALQDIAESLVVLDIIDSGDPVQNQVAFLVQKYTESVRDRLSNGQSQLDYQQSPVQQLGFQIECEYNRVYPLFDVIISRTYSQITTIPKCKYDIEQQYGR